MGISFPTTFFGLYFSQLHMNIQICSISLITLYRYTAILMNIIVGVLVTRYGPFIKIQCFNLKMDVVAGLATTFILDVVAEPILPFLEEGDVSSKLLS